MKKLRLILAAVAGMLLLAASARPATAAPARHPLGNFTVNQYSALTVQGDGIALRYVLDMAEIPAYQELGEIRADHSSALTAEEHEAYLARKTAELIANLELRVNGEALALQQRSAELTFPAGAGGLPTLRLDLGLFAPLPQSKSATLEYRDRNFSERIGWKEIIAREAGGGVLEAADVESADRSQALTSYPADMLNSPPQMHQASLRFSTTGVAPSGSASPAVASPAGGDWIAGRMDELTQLMTRPDMPLDALLIALMVAFVLGGAHALSPGHGKSVAAAYLVGSRGTPVHALLLGLSVTVTHTIGVFALGFITMFAAQYILPEQLYPWLSFASGVLVLAMGFGLFAARLQSLRRRGISLLPRLPLFSRPATTPAMAMVGASGHVAGSDALHGHTHAFTAGTLDQHHHAHGAAHDHQHDDGHDHSHDHSADHAHEHGEHEHRHWPWGKAHSHVAAARSHDHEHGADHAHDHDHSEDHEHEHGEHEHRHWPWSKPHSHVPADPNKAGIGSLIALGASGGLLPCPSALIVMLSAISFGRVGLGLLLILAFSMGLAAVLSGIGMLFLYARKLVERSPLDSRMLLRLPVFSALVVAALGLVITLQALDTTGLFR